MRNLAMTHSFHYNCFARALAVLMNRLLGIPVLNYFDDFGALVPEPLGDRALWMVGNTSSVLGAPMKTIKSLVDTQLTFLGLLGSFPGPQRGLLLSIELPQGKIAKWSQIIRDHIAGGRITSKHLEKLIGKLSFTQTSVFGRFGRTLLIALHYKLKERPYSEILSPRELDILSRRSQAIATHIARTVEIKPKFPEFVIYTDATTSTRITAALVFNNEVPSDFPIIDELAEEVSPPSGGKPSTAQHTFTASRCSPSGASFSP